MVWSDSLRSRQQAAVYQSAPADEPAVTRAHAARVRSEIRAEAAAFTRSLITRSTLRKTMQDQNKTIRTLRIGAACGIGIILCLFADGKSSLAWGFAIGALLSLFSVFSLVVAIPQLLRPDAPRHAQALLALTLFMKLPAYMAALYILTNTRGVSPVAGVFGITLVPAVLTAQAIGTMRLRRRRSPQPARVIAPVVAPPLPAIQDISAMSPTSASQTARPVRTGLATD
jgi:hypothetical protein